MFQLKRLASPQHYRFYFALTGPKTVLTDAEYEFLIDVAARDDLGQLKATLIDYIHKPRPLGKSWFEYIIDQFDYSQWQRLTAKQIRGMVLGMSDVMQEMLMTADHNRPSMLGIGQKAEDSVREGLKRLRHLDPAILTATLHTLWRDTRSLGWLVGEFYRKELQYHGRVGDRAQPDQLHALTGEQLDAAKPVLESRLVHPQTRLELRNTPTFLFLIWLVGYVGKRRTRRMGRGLHRRRREFREVPPADAQLEHERSRLLSVAQSEHINLSRLGSDPAAAGANRGR